MEDVVAFEQNFYQSLSADEFTKRLEQKLDSLPAEEHDRFCRELMMRAIHRQAPVHYFELLDQFTCDCVNAERPYEAWDVDYYDEICLHGNLEYFTYFFEDNNNLAHAEWLEGLPVLLKPDRLLLLVEWMIAIESSVYFDYYFHYLQKQQVLSVAQKQLLRVVVRFHKPGDLDRDSALGRFLWEDV